MRQKKILIQACVCIAVLAAVNAAGQAGLDTEDDKLGDILEKVADAVEENYTLAEILNLSEEAASTIAGAPAAVGEAVLSASEKGMYGEPMDKNSDEEIRQVYAVAGGKVLRAGIREDIGMYITVEHPDSGFGKGRISTYGNLCDITAATGDRIKKGDILGSFDSTGDKPFYYVLEDKS